MNLMRTIGALLLTAAMTAGARGQAQTQPSLDDLLNIKPAGPVDRAHPSTGGDVVVPPTGGDNPQTMLHRAVTQMRSASDHLGGNDPGLDTQRMQESVLSLIDQVIDQAQKDQQSSSSSSSSKSQGQPQQQQQDNGSQQNTAQGQQQGPTQGQPQAGQPNDPNTAHTAPGGIKPSGEAGPLEQNRAEWGNLPPRLRDQLLQGSGERFSPIYQDLTESYYRRLAEQQK